MSQWDERRPFDADAVEDRGQEPQQWPSDGAPAPYAAEEEVSVADAAPADVEAEPEPLEEADPEREPVSDPASEEPVPRRLHGHRRRAQG